MISNKSQKLCMLWGLFFFAPYAVLPVFISYRKQGRGRDGHLLLEIQLGVVEYGLTVGLHWIASVVMWSACATHPCTQIFKNCLDKGWQHATTRSEEDEVIGNIIMKWGSEAVKVVSSASTIFSFHHLVQVSFNQAKRTLE